MSQGPLCPNLTQKVQREVSQITNRNLPIAMLLGGLSVNLNHLKIIDVYQISDISRCPVRLMMRYLAKLPLTRSCQSLYLQPRKKFSPERWYLNRPVGVNTLQSVVKDVCQKAGLPGFYTNHNLRSTSATRMYRDGVDEQVIQEVTGHRSLAVRSYKRTSEAQCQLASKSIFGDV